MDDGRSVVAPHRRRFAVDHSGIPLDHVGSYSIDPAALPGNIDNFMGVAQVPIGLAGPLLVDGEHAAGEFYVPLAPPRGTLVASYNRGMRLLRACGGVTTIVVDDRMQRAPAFTFADAREARRFGEWVEQHHDEIKAVHAANALAALFVACGQDAANVAESQAALTYTQLLDNGDFYYSITLPSLIVATYGGGTGLPTQRECLELLGCYGPGKVLKFAEICAAVALTGEISLGAAVLQGDWVASHDTFGRNLP